MEHLEEASDPELVTIILNSEEDPDKRAIKERCLALLYQRYCLLLERIGHAEGLTCEDSGECAHITLSKVLVTAHLKTLSWDTPGSLEFYLRRSMKNRCIDYRRSHTAQPVQIPYDDVVESGITLCTSTCSERANPEQLFIQKEDMADLQKQIRKYLTSKEYRVVILRLRNATNTEIANEMALSPPQVARLFHKGIGKLRMVWISEKG